MENCETVFASDKTAVITEDRKLCCSLMLAETTEFISTNSRSIPPEQCDEVI
jgi:hypothetical protein